MKKTLTLAAIRRMNIKRMPLTPHWAEFLGAVPADAGCSFMFTGAPGSGKSTLSLQICDEFRRHGNVLYVCAEENIMAGGIKIRAEQNNISSERIHFLDTTDFEDIQSHLSTHKYRFCLIDSINKIWQTTEDGRKQMPINEVINIQKLYEFVYPVTFIFIAQTDKTRKTYKGDAGASHDVDVEILTIGKRDQPRYAHIEKSRLNPAVTQLHIFTPETKNSKQKKPIMTWNEIQEFERIKRVKDYERKQAKLLSRDPYGSRR